jgi:hypothetical protein
VKLPSVKQSFYDTLAQAITDTTQNPIVITPNEDMDLTVSWDNIEYALSATQRALASTVRRDEPSRENVPGRVGNVRSFGMFVWEYDPNTQAKQLIVLMMMDDDRISSRFRIMRAVKHLPFHVPGHFWSPVEWSNPAISQWKGNSIVPFLAVIAGNDGDGNYPQYHVSNRFPIQSMPVFGNNDQGLRPKDESWWNQERGGENGISNQVTTFRWRPQSGRIYVVVAIAMQALCGDGDVAAHVRYQLFSTVGNDADIAITGPDTMVRSDIGYEQYLVTVQHREGTSPLSNAAVRLAPLPATAQVVLYHGNNTTGSACRIDGTSGRCDIGQIAPNASYTISISIPRSDIVALSQQQRYTLTATLIDGSGNIYPDRRTDNNRASLTTAVIEGIDIGVQVQDMRPDFIDVPIHQTSGSGQVLLAVTRPPAVEQTERATSWVRYRLSTPEGMTPSIISLERLDGTVWVRVGGTVRSSNTTVMTSFLPPMMEPGQRVLYRLTYQIDNVPQGTYVSVGHSIERIGEIIRENNSTVADGNPLNDRDSQRSYLYRWEPLSQDLVNVRWWYTSKTFSGEMYEAQRGTIRWPIGETMALVASATVNRPEENLGIFHIRTQIVAWAPDIQITSRVFNPTTDTCPWSPAAPLSAVPTEELRKIGACALHVIPEAQLSRSQVQTYGFPIHPAQDTRDIPWAWNPTPNQRAVPGSSIDVRARFYILREIYEAPWIDIDEDGVYGGRMASLVEPLPSAPMRIQWTESVR